MMDPACENPRTARPATTGPQSAAAIEIRGVGYRYPGESPGAPGVEALSGVDLIVERGERLGIVGPNGGGKSTLLALVTGMRRPQTGSVRVFGGDPAAARDRGMIGYVTQRSEADRRFPIDARRVVAMPLLTKTAPWRRLGTEGRDRVTRALDLVGLSELADRPVDAMSGGQFQRLLIARAVVTEPALLVLDEPTVGIDVAGQQRFASLIDRLASELGLTILIVSHDLRAIAAGCDRVACLARTLHYHDAPGGLTPAVLAEVFHHDLVGAFSDDQARAAGLAEHADCCGVPEHHHPDDHAARTDAKTGGDA